MKNSGEIVEKPHFAHSFTEILATITHHAPAIVKGSIIFTDYSILKNPQPQQVLSCDVLKSGDFSFCHTLLDRP